jgi:Prealbumin-like fold domain
MRTTAVFASCLLLAGVAQAECVALEPQKSSGHVRIAVVLNGKPLKGVTVSIYQDYPPAAHFSDLTTDENGIVALPELSRGTYDVSATFQGVVTSSLSLGVTTVRELSAFSIDLTEPVQRAEKIPVHHRLQAFRGTVVDPSEAMIPGANVMVVRRDPNCKMSF